MAYRPEIAGRFKRSVPAPLPKPALGVVRTISADPGTWNMWWSFARSGDYIYGAFSGNTAVIDISTPSSASIIDSITSLTSTRASDISGTTLVTVSREGVGGDGYIKTWDISVPAAIPAELDSFQGVGIRYSNVVVDGTDAYVSGRVSGAYKFDISTPASISLTASNETGSWETQGIAHYGLYVFFANYHHGLRILDKATMTTTDNVVPAPSLNGQSLRIWDCVISDDGNWLFATTNTLGNENSPERGLAILDISNPTTSILSTDWIIAPVGLQDNDTWNGAGDKQLLMLTKYKDWILAGNGQSGVAMWHVKNPQKPTYAGRLGVIAADDNITGILNFRVDSKEYLIFGDGARLTGTDGNDNLYIGELTL